MAKLPDTVASPLDNAAGASPIEAAYGLWDVNGWHALRRQEKIRAEW